MFFVAVAAAFIKVETDTGEHGNGPVYDTDHGSQFDFGRILPEEIAASFSFLAIQYPFLFEFQQDVFQEFERDLFLFGDFGNQYRAFLVFLREMSERLERVLRLF